MTERTVDPTAHDEAHDRRALAIELAQRWPAVRSAVAAGTTSIVVGGVVAALTRPLDFEAGPWTAAFLVLVGGVAQISLAIGRAWLPVSPPDEAEARLVLVLWNASVVGTIVGTIVQMPAITTLAGAALALDLAVVWRGLRTASPSRRRVARAVRAVLLVVLVSIPIGLLLAWVRHG